jgi:lipopolysaccharide transport system ATP-binding protein
MSSEPHLPDQVGATPGVAPAGAGRDADIAVRLSGVSKCYHIYDRPQDRLKQALVPRLQRLVGQAESRWYRDFWALRDLSIDIRRGETLGVIGRNGSGKSTLLQILCGTLSPTTGQVQVRGRIGALLELGSGFNPEFTGRENVYLNGAVLGLTREQIDARYDDILAFADIGDFIGQPVKTYSSGMYVRLAFAVIAHCDADVLVIDEALSVGDVFFGQKCMRFLRGFQEHGTVIFVSHDENAVKGLCERAILLDQGRMQMDGRAKTVCEAYHAQLYGRDVRPLAIAPRTDVETPAPPRDPALLPGPNPIEVFRFDPAAGFGDGSATVRSVALLDPAGQPLGWVEGGEDVTLRIEAEASGALDSPIVGFHFKDRLGQILFGDNTWRAHRECPVPVAAGQGLVAEFDFRMPILPAGRYSVDVAVADGTYDAHRQAQWVHDAFVLESHSSSVSTGLVGIPFSGIRLRRDENSGRN